jgi:integrase
MASIRKRPNGIYEVRYIGPDNERTSIYLPAKTTKLEATTVGSKVDHIVARQITGNSPDPTVAQWLAGLPAKLYDKLARAGLTAPKAEPEAEPVTEQPPSKPTLNEWTRRCIEKHSGKASTVEQLEITARGLLQYFGPDRSIETITPGDAEDFRNWLQTAGSEYSGFKTGLADNTVRRRIGRCKQFFHAAVKHELIARNPFADEVSAVRGNADRLFLVPAAWIEACIRVAPCEDWRIILALARYGGLRSHECRLQRWEDIDLANNRMMVRSNKTPPVRPCPIFPELRPHLLRAREMAPAGAEFVQTRYQTDANIQTTLAKIVTKAGLTPWPKLMQNLRATRETELLAHYPAKDVTTWLGNSPEVAAKHYAMPMQQSFQRAVVEGAKLDGLLGGAAGTMPQTAAGVLPKKVPLKVPQTFAETAGKRQPTKTAGTQNPAFGCGFLLPAVGVTLYSCPTRTRT